LQEQTQKHLEKRREWAAEGFEKYSQNFDISEWSRLHYFDVVKDSSTPENITF
jgi:hypothetical protein